MANTSATFGQVIDLGGEIPATSMLAVGYTQPGQVGLVNGTSAGVTTSISAGAALIMSGSGTPGSMVATIGSLYLRTDSSAISAGNTTARIYVNYTGTAWTPLQSAS